MRITNMKKKIVFNLPSNRAHDIMTIEEASEKIKECTIFRYLKADTPRWDKLLMTPNGTYAWVSNDTLIESGDADKSDVLKQVLNEPDKYLYYCDTDLIDVPALDCIHVDAVSLSKHIITAKGNHSYRLFQEATTKQYRWVINDSTILDIAFSSVYSALVYFENNVSMELYAEEREEKK